MALTILRRMIKDNKWDWHKKVSFTLWVDRLTPKTSTSQIPYTMVYGTIAILRIHLQILALRLAIAKAEADFWPLQHHLDNLVELHEVRKDELQQF